MAAEQQGRTCAVDFRGPCGRGRAKRRKACWRHAFAVVGLFGSSSFGPTTGAPLTAGDASAARQLPNIILIVTDDQRWDTLRYMPAVTRKLVERGVKFENGFVTNPLCCPSRTSILTGAYSHSTHVYSNNGFWQFHDSSTIATWLHAAGYRTALIGKYLNGYQGSYVPPGWDRWVAFRRGELGYYRYGFDVDGRDSPLARRRTYSTDFLAQKAVSFVRNARRPFFLYFAPYGPHAPATPARRHAGAFADLSPWRPPSYDEQDVSDKPRWVRALPPLLARDRSWMDSLRRRQLQSLLAVDDAVSKLIAEVRRARMMRKTFIVYTSDNGLIWGEHRVKAKKRAFYEEAIHVPFVVRYGALIHTARRERRPVLGIDLAPTFAELSGTKAPGSEGRSILALLRNSSDSAWRKSFLIEQKGSKRNSKWPPTYCAVRTHAYAFATYRTGERELYDLRRDRFQNENHAGSTRATRIAGLRRRLGRLCNPPPPGLSRKLLCTLAGTKRGDALDGSPRYDIVCGRRGDDVLDPQGGHDFVFAGPGADRVTTRDGVSDVISCGSGTDVVLADDKDRVRANCERLRLS
jgi:N-acetylglucosamine-6-sulfatase